MQFARISQFIAILATATQVFAHPVNSGNTLAAREISYVRQPGDEIWIQSDDKKEGAADQAKGHDNAQETTSPEPKHHDSKARLHNGQLGGHTPKLLAYERDDPVKA